ncbi:spermidine/putrescine transport system permease protein [Thioclava sp. ES.031]|uniref:ABC transporter permease n=1 Tax=Thioclava sp. ES.031 TaxID=1798203 RepID=UPI000BF4C058|nr:ABC transporter permease [Thioclava sp. ES.031]PFG62090.1 spermidine/putrescine transport system permease protein [Thioclava sp. ES.031]
MAEIQKSWRDGALRLSTLPLLLLMGLFFVIPLIMTALLSFQGTQYYRLVWTWDLKVWTDVFSQVHYWTIMWRTLMMALVCTVLCTILAIPIAYGMLHRLSRWSDHITLLMVFAFLTDAVLKTFGWVLFLDRSGVLNGTLEAIGFPPAAVNVLFTPNATMIGMVYNLLPYTIFTIALSMARIDGDLVLAARDAGASRLRAFIEVTLPLAKPGIWAGAVLVFVLSLGVFLEPKVMGGGTSPLAAELIRQSFETRVNWPLGAALTLVLIVIGAAALTVFGAVALWQARRVVND